MLSTSRICLTAAVFCSTLFTGETAVVSVLKDGHMTWDDRSSADHAEASAVQHAAEHSSDAEESLVSSPLGDSELTAFLHREEAKESSQIGYGHVASMIQQEMHESSGEKDADLEVLLELFQRLSEDNATIASSSSLLQEGDKADQAAAAFLDYVQRVYSNVPVDAEGPPPKGFSARAWAFFQKAQHNLKDVRSGIGNQIASVGGLVLGPNSCILKFFFMFFTLDGEDDYPYFPSGCGVTFSMTSV